MIPPQESPPKEVSAPPLPATRTDLRAQLRPLLLGVPLLTLLTGAVFPLVLAAFARPLFPDRADGSLIVRDGVVVGSELIAQNFSRPGYFHPRPSSAGDGYDAAASNGSNLGPANPKLREAVRDLAEAYRHTNGLPPDAAVPIDAVTRSGSGLDPHISPANAALQTARVARERRLAEEDVRRLVAEHTLGPQLGFLGAPHVNVLALNLALDRAAPLSAAR
ncbi:MAG TPA: potassium-transporting ATPase subunit KdpC [Gemmataceae bacterium]|nr:potassium-transporting ATPase subunit KdpC [Gemmataceae bacterium]